MEQAAAAQPSSAAAGPVLGKVAGQEGASTSAAAAVAARRGEGDCRGEEEVPLRVRLGRAARRRAGPCTPSPSWKLEGEGEEEEVEVAVAPARRSSASARQLGASLWEIHDVTREGRGGGSRRRRSGRALAGGGGVELHQNSGGFGRHIADSSTNHQKLNQARNRTAQPFSPGSYRSSIGDSSINQAISPARSLDIKGRFRGAGYNLKTSTELLKVLNRIWSLEEQHTADMSAINGLKLELQHAQEHIQELKCERRGYRHDVASLVRQLSEDKLVRKNKDKEKIAADIHSLQDELEDEKRLRRHSEDLHRKFGKELSEIKSAFVKAVKDLEKEKKTKSLLEDLCDQFAMGIRDYEEEVRALKQRHVNYEYQFDKSVLHVSEAWLDERMQMQNTDVKEDSLKKSTITERLRSEIEAFLIAKRSISFKNNDKYMHDSRPNARLRRQSLESVHFNGATSAPQLAEDDDDDSVASDLHCFELNMHGSSIQKHDHTGPRRSYTGNMDAPKRRTEYSHSVVGESSHMSDVQIYSQGNKARSGSSRPWHATRTQEIDSQASARTVPAEEQDEIPCPHISQGYRNGTTSKNNLGAHADCLGQESLDHYSRASLFCDGTTSGDLCNPHSPSRQLDYPSASLGHEIGECSTGLPVGMKENTLKAKLLQARLEGRHARLKSSGGSVTSRRK
uniref:Intracellular protein transport protein USO1-like n=1 Tax=Oryza meridionalis TaxID=40149 RepID=A0A0E0CIQ6_9ORYZ